MADDARQPTTDDYWVCACVRRDRAGNLKAIRRNHPDVAECPTCHRLKADADRDKAATRND